MKTFVLLGIIFISLNSLAQEFVAETIQHHKILYRGFENKVIVNQIGCETNNYDIEPINCVLIDPVTDPYANSKKRFSS